LIYTEMPRIKVALAHAHAARLLAAESAAPETIAGHLLGAPPAGDGWVVDILRRRARHAQARNAPEVAARYLARALDEPPPPEIRGDVLAELGSAEAAAGLDSAIEHLRQSIELMSGARERARVRGLLGRTLAGLGRHKEAAAALETALDGLSRDDPELNWLLVDYLANATFETGLRQRAFARAADLLGEVPTGSTPADRALLAPMAMRSGQEGEPAVRTLELADRAWSDGQLLVDQGSDGNGWMMAVWATELAGDHARAERITTMAIEEARRAGSVDAFAAASYFRAWSRWRLGRLVEAQADVEQAIETTGTVRRRYRLAALALKADVLVDRDELAAAEQVLAAADHEDGQGMEVAWRLHARGRLALATGDLAGALRFCTDAGAWLVVQLGVEHTVLPWRTDAARAALALGDLALVRNLGERDLAQARQTGAPAHLGRALAILGLADDRDGAVETLQEASTQLGLAGEALHRAQTLVDLGALLRRRGARGEARGPLTDALDVASRLGALGLARRARDELRASGARPRTEVRSGPDALTPSERRVAELAVGGRTNVEIAQALFVTPKTIEYHLRHVYQKLGITRRVQISAALAAEHTERGVSE
jgi:DNA-binding CsgD family transcriptional regulator